MGHSSCTCEACGGVPPHTFVPPSPPFRPSSLARCACVQLEERGHRTLPYTPPPSPSPPPLLLQAVKSGAAGLRLYADSSNLRAQDTYRSLGMRTHYLVFEDLITKY